MARAVVVLLCVTLSTMCASAESLLPCPRAPVVPESVTSLYLSDEPGDLLLGAALAAKNVTYCGHCDAMSADQTCYSACYEQQPSPRCVATLAQSDYDTSAFLGRAIDLDPGNPLVWAATWRYCDAWRTYSTNRVSSAVDTAAERVLRPDRRVCATDPVVHLVQTDPGNAFPVVLQALAAFRNGRQDQALELVKQATNALRFDVYFGATAQTLSLAWTRHFNLAERQQVLGPVGIAAAMGLPDLKELIEMCRTTGAKSAAWRHACADLGRFMEANAWTIMSERIGVAILVMALEFDGESTELTAARARRQDRPSINFELMQEIPDMDPYWEVHLHNLVEVGESEALRLAIEEARARRANE